MALSDFTMEMVSKLVFKLLPHNDKLTLVLGRTNWQFGSKNINILMPGISGKNLAISIMFQMIDNKGNTNTAERIGLLKRFIEWFGSDRINCPLADREFVGSEWIGFLNQHDIRYHIRIRNNFKIKCGKSQKEVKAYYLFNGLKANQLYHYPNIIGCMMSNATYLG